MNRFEHNFLFILVTDILSLYKEVKSAEPITQDNVIHLNEYHYGFTSSPFYIGYQLI